MHRPGRRNAWAVAALALALAGCGGGGQAGVSTTHQDSASTAVGSSAATARVSGPASGSATGSTAAPSGYITYATYQQNAAGYSAGPVVLFFHATWCPDCQRTDKNLAADPASVPAGVTIVKVDYDSMTDLKQKYGVTRQWTFVSIGADGAKQKAWTGTDTGAEIAAQIAARA